MGSLAGNFQRPVVAAAAVALASFSSNISDKIPSPNLLESCSTSEQSHSSSSELVQGPSFSLGSRIAFSKLMSLAFVNRIRVPVPNINFRVPNWSDGLSPNMLGSSPTLFPLVNLYQSAELAKGPHSSAYTKTIPTSCPDVLYRWHLPDVDAIDLSGTTDCSLAKSKTVVVLLGWLGSKQKHLKKYAEWYTARGFHVITFTFPLSEVLSYQVGGKAEQDIELLVNHLADWLDGEHGKNLVFHTFSNTGWLTYGVMLEKFQKHDPSLLGRVKGCIVDSAPVAAPDPQVWALGFSAAFLKKNSVATKVQIKASEPAVEVSVGSKTTELKPTVSETALLMILEKFFGVVLNIPTVNKRLTDVVDLLSSKQPSCPQLYIYSSADRVIPVSSVESFIEEQRKAGHEVRACDFVHTPHVDHFRNDPKRYTTQLSQFLDDCVITRCKS